MLTAVLSWMQNHEIEADAAIIAVQSNTRHASGGQGGGRG